MMRLMYCSALDIMLTIGRLLNTLTTVDIRKLGFFIIATNVCEIAVEKTDRYSGGSLPESRKLSGSGFRSREVTKSFTHRICIVSS